MPESLSEFVERLSEEVGCHYHANKGSKYSLKVRQDACTGPMGVFAWVSERVKTDRFLVKPYADRVPPEEASKADRRNPGGHFGTKDSLWYYVKRGSTGDDFRTAVAALKSAKANTAQRIRSRQGHCPKRAARLFGT